MPEVLSRLRAIEKEVCARLTDNMEHVGSIKVLQHGGKRAMPIFEPADKDAEALQRELAAARQTAQRDGRVRDAVGEVEAGSETEGEEEQTVQQMEQDALEALAQLKIDVDGKGAAALEITMNDGKQTWRTARWTERPTVLGGTAFSSAFTSQVPAGTADAGDDTDSAQVHDKRGGGGGVGEMASTMTVRASPPNTPIAPNKVTLATNTSPGAPVTESQFAASAASKEDATAAVVKNKENLGAAAEAKDKDKDAAAPRRRLQTKAERADELAAKTALPIASGTHRFTLIDKETLQVMAGKRPSHCMSLLDLLCLR
jgi:hypothetical protein